MKMNIRDTVSRVMLLLGFELGCDCVMWYVTVIGCVGLRLCWMWVGYVLSLGGLCPHFELIWCWFMLFHVMFVLEVVGTAPW